MTVNGELGRTWKKAFVAFVKVPSHNLPGEVMKQVLSTHVPH